MYDIVYFPMQLSLVWKSPFPQYFPCNVCLVIGYNNIKSIYRLNNKHLLVYGYYYVESNRNWELRKYCLIFGNLKSKPINNVILWHWHFYIWFALIQFFNVLCFVSCKASILISEMYTWIFNDLMQRNHQFNSIMLYALWSYCKYLFFSFSI